MDTFPPNSKKAVDPAPAPKRVEQVTSAEAVRRRRRLGRQFSHTFFGGDAHTALEYMIGNVILPSVKEMMVEAASSGFERLIYGEARPRRGAPQANPLGHFAYNRVGQQGPPGRAPQPAAISRQARARHSFDDIIINSRQEAEEVLDRLYDLLSKYESASVADLYDLVGIASQHTDYKWGWTNLRGAGVGRVRGGGYLFELPEPQPLG
jgi:hypothetical protein